MSCFFFFPVSHQPGMPEIFISLQPCLLLPCACAFVTVPFTDPVAHCVLLHLLLRPWITAPHLIAFWDGTGRWSHPAEPRNIRWHGGQSPSLNPLEGWRGQMDNLWGNTASRTASARLVTAASFCSAGDSDWMFFSPAVHWCLVCFPPWQSVRLKSRLMQASYSSISRRPTGLSESGLRAGRVRRKTVVQASIYTSPTISFEFL